MALVTLVVVGDGVMLVRVINPIVVMNDVLRLPVSTL